MQVIKSKSWSDFKRHIEEYVRLSSVKRGQIIFRGQVDSRWSLTTTLDRRRKFADQLLRRECIDRLVRAFKRNCVGALENTAGLVDDLEWELLGRHHGLPTPILDWTESPYMAAFFAFDDAAANARGHVSIWALDCEFFENNDSTSLEVIDNVDLVRFNLRAVDQRAVFLRVIDSSQPLVRLLSSRLVRYDVPAAEARTALTDLDAMNVNARAMFRNLDGAARLADRRILFFGDD
ncbi:MAG: FRG domain-containing protein [Phycisphaeraceae bacterium]